MNGNVTKEGITADLEAMKQIGLSGAQIFNVDCEIPAGPVKFNSPEWHQLFTHCLNEADRLGLQICVHNCAGWSSSGGPWNTPEHAMQHVVTSELRLTGPSLFDGALPQPPTMFGFYRDIATLAFKAPLTKSMEIDNLQAKAGFSGDFVNSSAATTAAPGQAIERGGIVDLTSRLRHDGKLKWKVPAGNWIILRVGYTPKDQENHPAPPEGTGLECDKFTPAALDAHWAGFVQNLVTEAGPLAGKTFNNVLIDSYEVGGQNWSANFRAEFKKRRGYDPRLLLPAFSGRVVDNMDVSERFLWDVRRTIADLFAENYYGHFAQLCHQYGLLASFEPYTGPYESLQCGRAADVVMGEFWSGTHGDPSVKLAASIAHIYGKQIAAAESFTSSPEQARWQNDPWALKPLGDLMFCTGLNRYIFHRYAMQPWTNRWPGMTMGQWGLNFERTVTWWDQGNAWIDYVSRCQFLLQQGRFVADAACFCGENAPSEMPDINPPLPAGYDYDAINSDVLLHRARMKNGRLTLLSGASYSALVLLHDDPQMTPQLLRKIRGFVRDGLTVAGPRPRHSPSLQGFPKCDQKVKSLADDLWGQCDGTTVTEHPFGKGRVICGPSLAGLFAARGLKPDFEFTNSSPSAKLAFCHRLTDQADIYFLSNQRRQFESADCTFRISSKLPELWHPDTGQIELAPIWSQQDGRTTVHIQFEPAGSVFVIFRRPALQMDTVVAVSGPERQPPAPAPPKIHIVRALYQAEDGAGTNDVTATVAGLSNNGSLEILASNSQFGGDPAFGHTKQLRVDYTLDGQPKTATVSENEPLTLPPSASEGEAPSWNAASLDGRPCVRTSINGAFQLTTAAGKTLQVSVDDLPAPVQLTNDWDLAFPPDWGAPSQIHLDKLISWTDHTNQGVRYFSGTATYQKDIEIPADFLRQGREVWLDLGIVKNFAQVSLNGQLLATLWKPPFRVNLTSVALPGINRLQVKVTNLWPNRLIGDEQLADDRQWDGDRLKAWPDWLLDGKPSPTGRLTFTTWRHWKKDDALPPSGLIGPVRLQPWQTVPAN
jgi:hypothetical protein